jgi:hypothetical protein
MIAAPARNALASIANPAICVMVFSGPSKFPTPRGFVTLTSARSANAPVSCPGVMAQETIAIANEPINSHRAGRQRLDGSFPSGKSRKIGMNTPSITTINHRSNHAAATPKGSEPGRVLRASVA